MSKKTSNKTGSQTGKKTAKTSSEKKAARRITATTPGGTGTDSVPPPGDREETTASLRDRAIDHELALVSRSFRFLLDVTPMNVEQARAEFLATGELPEFQYRTLEDDPDVLRQDVILYDRHTGTRTNITGDVLRANDTSWEPKISATGRHIVFGSNANNLGPRDTNDNYDIFRYDRRG